jgi:ribonuclease HII
MAKVSRDRIMKKKGIKFPKYGFERHKGYGTIKHKNAILNFGVCEEHRKSFIH